MITIGIESSCDETAVAILEGPDRVLASEIASQNDAHAAFGGIVPEVAARIHAEIINHIIARAFDKAGVSFSDINLISVTVGPGLVVSLIVAISAARALSACLDIPIVGVNHLEGHLMSNFLADPAPEPPAVCLLVSGGHTDLILVRGIGDYQVLGRTRDDAAGEAFDKAARVIGLAYPGGPAIQKAAELSTGDPVHFPRPMINDGGLDFSFSGLKTAVIVAKKKLDAACLPVPVNEFAAGLQEAAVDVLVTKTLRAAKKTRVKIVLLCGGVAANKPLRERFQADCAKAGLNFFSPPFNLCTDNAAMVAKAGYENFTRKLPALPLSPQPGLSL